MKRLIPFCALLLLAGCSEDKPVEKAKEPPKPAEPISGQKALFEMYRVARTWAGDAQILNCSDIRLAEPKSTTSKAAAWQCTFVAPLKQKSRTFSYSVVEAGGNLHKGVFSGLDEDFNGQRGQQKPFLISAVKTDTDAAYETALKHSEDYVKKNPDKPISFLLELTNRHPAVVWRVVWGESVGTSDYSVFVDAGTGEFAGKAH